jgi:hypothetical protein
MEQKAFEESPFSTIKGRMEPLARSAASDVAEAKEIERKNREQATAIAQEAISEGEKGMAGSKEAIQKAFDDSIASIASMKTEGLAYLEKALPAYAEVRKVADQAYNDIRSAYSGLDTYLNQALSRSDANFESQKADWKNTTASKVSSFARSSQMVKGREISQIKADLQRSGFGPDDASYKQALYNVEVHHQTRMADVRSQSWDHYNEGLKEMHTSRAQRGATLSASHMQSKAMLGQAMGEVGASRMKAYTSASDSEAQIRTNQAELVRATSEYEVKVNTMKATLDSAWAEMNNTFQFDAGSMMEAATRKTHIPESDIMWALFQEKEGVDQRDFDKLMTTINTVLNAAMTGYGMIWPERAGWKQESPKTSSTGDWLSFGTSLIGDEGIGGLF